MKKIFLFVFIALLVSGHMFFLSNSDKLTSAENDLIDIHNYELVG